MDQRHGDVIPPLTPRSLLGYEARRLREELKLSLNDVAKIAACDKTYLSRVERAEKFPSEIFIVALDKALGAGGLLKRLWEAAYHNVFPDYVRRFMELEPKATKMQKYMVQTVPGLWQTEEYARELIRTKPRLTDDRVEEMVVARLARQRILNGSKAPLFWAVLDEAVLRRAIGGPRIMAAQLAHVVRMAKQPNAIVQVLPFSVGAHASTGGSLTMLSFADDSDMAYTEGVDSGHLTEAREAVAEFGLRYDLVRAKALSPEASIDMIQQAAEEYQRWSGPS
ncbi:helix-turn-helix domain-containing protein [Streptomyces hainanensis]|uniref:XRE family transcriptional regulator n=1 Tax=Streptomyces hainanensis TaxID=402648 RepID=A0A4R4TU21_9ACTN|nr:helix-turn-helix transcriptional regulator [Streptomyces hainanensis]TDC78653.1 XRE family transcriptional regulator [Streptomyces hainanensis]